MTDGHVRPLTAAPMHCRDVQALGWEFLDGELDDERTAGVRLHVAACPPCRARLEGARSFLRAVLGTWHSDAAPSGLRQRVTSSLRAQGLLA